MGRKSGEKLVAEGVETIADLRRADPAKIRKRHSVVLERTVRELNSVNCLPPTAEKADRAQVMYSRSFSSPVSTVAELDEVMNLYTQRAAFRLAAQGMQARVLTVSAGTSRFNGEASFPSRSVALPQPTADPMLLTRFAVSALRSVVVPGTPYVRAGVMLSGLERDGEHGGTEQLELFDLGEGAQESLLPDAAGSGPAGGNGAAATGIGSSGTDLNSLLASVKGRFGMAAIGLGRGGFAEEPEWSMKREFRSHRFTTEWDELPIARA